MGTNAIRAVQAGKGTAMLVGACSISINIVKLASEEQATNSCETMVSSMPDGRKKSEVSF
jgi:hypothetical protein